MAARDISLDVARGMAMILVVMGHSIRGLAAAHIGPREIVGTLDTFLYLVRLPVFAVAVGILTPASVERHGWRRFLLRRLSLLAYLYLLWTLLQGTAEVLSTPWKNRPTGWGDVVAFWIPIGHLWFLPHLMVTTVVLLLVRPWRPGPRATVGLVVVAAISVAGWGWYSIWIGLGGLALLVFYLVGAAIGAERYRRWTAALPGPLLVGVGTAALLVVAAMIRWLPVTAPTAQSERTTLSVALGVVGVGLAIVGGLALSVAWARSRTSAWVAYVGRQSLAVYLAHIVVTAGTRVALVRLGVTDLVVHVLLGTLFGVVFPLLLERATRRVPYLFVPPWVIAERRARAALEPSLRSSPR